MAQESCSHPKIVLTNPPEADYWVCIRCGTRLRPKNNDK